MFTMEMPRPPKRTPTILVIDDDPSILEIETIVLADHGFNVIPSNSAKEGLAIVADSGPIDLVLCDLVLVGEMDGWSFAERSREIRPKIKIVFTSGYVAAPAIANLESTGTHVLRKPWRPDELIVFIRRALAS